jgi:hypothetical protein
VHVESAHSHGPLLGLHVLKALLRVGRVEEARALAGKLVEGKPGARDVLGPYTNFLLRAQEDGPAGGAAAWAEGALRFEQFHPVSGSLEQREVLHEEAVSVLLSADKHADATAYHAECSLRVPLDSLKSGTHA